ncbi:MAG: type II secretion system protein [Akkermansiaceae bacterium]
MKKTISHTSNKGFTLIELMIVIVIVATLVAISITAVFRFRKSADKVLVLGSLKQLQNANIAYSSDNQGRFVPPEEEIETVFYQWFENPDFISQVKGVSATFSSTDAPDISLPIEIMDPEVVREKPTGYESLSRSYAYTRPLTADPIIVSQIIDSARSAAFITANSNGFIENSTRAKVAYRHDEKAVVVYYDGHASTISEADMNEIQTQGGASSIFWEAIQ